VELSFNFELAVYSAWLLAMGTLVGLTLWAPAVWQTRRAIVVPRPRREALVSLAAAALLVALSVVTDQLLRPWKKDPQFGAWVFLAQLAIVYSPFWAILVWRREGLDTAFLRAEKLPAKIILGLSLATLAAAAFLAVRGRLDQFAAFVPTLSRGGPVAMLQTFVEGFGVGFVLYRVGAWLGIRATAVLVATLFMAAHLPNYLQGTYEHSLADALAFAAAHAGIAVVVIASVWWTQDIIVLGFVHWFINAASSFTT